MNFTPNFKKKTAKILVVDDDAIFGKIVDRHLCHLKEQFKSKGIELEYHVVKTSREAFRKMDQNCDILILDHFLDTEDDSDITGLDLIQEFKQIAPKSKVIMVTSKNNFNENELKLMQSVEFFVRKECNTISRLINILNHKLSIDNF